MDTFKTLKIGSVPNVYGTHRIFASRVKNGCRGCFFDKEQGAKHCEMKESCMAHYRPDRTPVIFIAK